MVPDALSFLNLSVSNWTSKQAVVCLPDRIHESQMSSVIVEETS